MGLDRDFARDGPVVAGRYALYDKIAAGGMATIHLGRLLGPIGFSRTVAIKRMLPQFVSDLGFVSMFVDEARLASRIRHPNVVPTLDVVAQKNELFLVLEYVHGETLSQLIKSVSSKGRRIPPPLAAAIVCGLLHGLHAAHNVKNERGRLLGLVHRDVSPQNVIVGTDGVARLLDFGVAKAAGRMQVTTNGEVKGKLAYMAPEQVKGTVTPQSDVYSAAAVLWEALTCERLFSDVTWNNIAQVIMHREVGPPSRIVSNLPAALDAIVLRGLEKDPRKRFASARDMAVAIESCMTLAPTHEVGEWVEETALEVLAERAQKIAEIESRSSEAKMAAASMALVQGPVTGAPAEADADPTRPDQRETGSQLTVADETAEDGAGTQLTQISSHQRPGGQRRGLRYFAGLALLAFTFGAGGWVLAKSGETALPSPAGSPATATLNVTEPSGGEPERPLTRSTQGRADPVAGHVEAEPQEEDPSKASSPAPLPSTGPPPINTRRPPPSQSPPAKRASPCNPPYVIDENHIRHIKPQCL